MSLFPAYLLQLFNGNVHDKIHNKHCLINCHGTTIIYVKNNLQTVNLILLTIKRFPLIMMAFKHWEDLHFDVDIPRNKTKLTPKTIQVEKFTWKIEAQKSNFYFRSICKIRNTRRNTPEISILKNKDKSSCFFQFARWTSTDFCKKRFLRNGKCYVFIDFSKKS